MSLRIKNNDLHTRCWLRCEQQPKSAWKMFLQHMINKGNSICAYLQRKEKLPQKKNRVCAF